LGELQAAGGRGYGAGGGTAWIPDCCSPMSAREGQVWRAGG
jgi:hypothetical protein